jgi:DNA-binding transcriptional MerR regulator
MQKVGQKTYEEWPTGSIRAVSTPTRPKNNLKRKNEDTLKDKLKTWTISQLAEELDIAPSKIRYYEQKKLLSPRRSKGQQRIFDKNDRTRLKLILRGTRLGLSLDKVAEILGLGNNHLPEVEQLRRALSHLTEIKQDLQERKKEIATFEEEVDLHTLRMKDRLSELKDEN